MRAPQDEHSPLLARSQSAITTVSHLSARVRTWEQSRRIIHVFMLVVLLISLGDQWIESPQNRIQEAVICYRYFEQVDPSKILLSRRAVGPGAIGGVDEHWCKADQVQADLASLRGWQVFFDGIPSLALAMPFGWIADRYGRKPLVLLGLFSLTSRAAWVAFVTWFWQAFDIRMQWLSTIFASLGGGTGMISSLAFVVLSDVTPEARRGDVFLRIGAFNLLANLVMPPFAAWLMSEYTPWIPVMGGIGLSILSILVFAFTPETLHYARGGFSNHRDQPPSSTDTTAQPPPPPDLAPNQEPISLNTANMWITKAREGFFFLFEDWRIPVLIIPFVLQMLLGASGQLMIQYMSKRYDITFAKATLVATIRSAMIVVLLFIILPWLSDFLVDRMRVSPQRKDLNLARLSQGFLSVGWFAFGFAPNVPFAAVTLVIASLGQGAAFLFRSFLTSLLPRNRIASTYSFITIIETLGSMFGSPFLAQLLKDGLRLGGGWIGLPFYFVGLVSGVITLLLLFMGLRKGEDGDGDADGEQ